MAEQENGWRELRFHMNLDKDWENAEPVHLLIANELLRPSIEQFEEKMLVWRIHRMYGSPEASHRLMFKFYGPESTALQIKTQLESHESIDGLRQREGLRLEGFVTKGSKIEDDFDGNWPEEIRAIWPYYICGASRAWLKLIERIAGNRTDFRPGISYEAKRQVYGKIRDEIDKYWAEYGSHAMLHHLNAIFGYKYIKVCRPSDFIKTLQEVTLQNGDCKMPGILAEMKF